MAELATLARPYANAAFDLAKASDRIAEWGRTLGLLAQACATAEVELLITSPVMGSFQKAHHLIELFEPGDLNEEMRRFVNVLAENQRLELLPEISVLFEQLQAEEQQTMEVTVTTAVSLNEAEQSNFLSALTQRFKREIELSTEVDPNVLGGALIRAEDTVLDGTVRGKLEKMQEALKRA